MLIGNGILFVVVFLGKILTSQMDAESEYSGVTMANHPTSQAARSLLSSWTWTPAIFVYLDLYAVVWRISYISIQTEFFTEII